MNLDDGTRVGPANIIVQFVHVQTGQYVDVLGNNSPDSIVVGSGEALILRDGKLLHKRWTRPTSSQATHYVDDKGNDIKLSPGQTWIMIVAVDRGRQRLTEPSVHLGLRRANRLVPRRTMVGFPTAVL